MEKILYRRIDSAPLIVFRIIFGLLIFLESIGAIFTGWVKENLIKPEFTFNFIGFDFLQPLPGNGMYFYYLIMGIFGFFVMIGFRYRLSIICFFLMWTSTYLMQKSAYNNHYYLTVLLSFIMIFLPANRSHSVDVRLRPAIKKNTVPYWTSLVLIAQITIVYFFGAVAKLYPDWLTAEPVAQFLSTKTTYPIIGPLLAKTWFHYLLSYSGVIFDFLIIPLFLYKPTRKIALILSITFHLFNAVIFQIGIFPFLSLAFALFFFDPTTIRRIFFKNKSIAPDTSPASKIKSPLMLIAICYFIIQLALPIRHWFIDGNVLWTEEGHRLSWRMMLRAKSGFQHFTVIDKKDRNKIPIRLNDYLTSKQISSMAVHPDMIWQFAQRLKKQYAENGQDISVFVDGAVSVNGRTSQPLIDNAVDIANVPWRIVRHHYWVKAFKE